jgi:hypothetical protein
MSSRYADYLLVTAYAELRMLSEHERQGEAVNCGVYVVSAARHTYIRLVAIFLKLIVWLCRERPGQW